MKTEKSLRRQRFESVAARRVQRVLELLDVLGNCANSSNYEYTEEDVRKMFSALESKLKTTRALYSTGVAKDEVNVFKF
jgi:hypothetical protein